MSFISVCETRDNFFNDAVFFLKRKLSAAGSHLACILSFLNGYEGVITLILSSPFHIDLYNRQKVLNFGIYHNGFYCLISSNGLSSLYLHWDLSYLLAFFHIFRSLSSCKTLFIRHYINVLGFLICLKKRWLHYPGIKIMSQKETPRLQKTLGLNNGDYFWPDPFPPVSFNVFLLSSDFRFDSIAARTFSFI